MQANHWWNGVTVKIPRQQYCRARSMTDGFIYLKHHFLRLIYDGLLNSLLFKVQLRFPSIKANTMFPTFAGITGADRGRVYPLVELERVSSSLSCNGMSGMPWNGDTTQQTDTNRWYRLDLVVPNVDA